MTRTITRLALAAAIAVTPVARALAQGSAAPWPSQAEGRPLPREPWVLVVPARRMADGSLSIWERDDPWTKAWRVPRVFDGLRVVTLFGDAEDRRNVTSAAIDGMVIASLGLVQRKYGAPAIALAVTDGAEVAVAGYVPGSQASWQGVSAGAGDAEARENAVRTLAAMFRASSAQLTRGADGREAARPDAPAPDVVATDPPATVTVRAYRASPEGGTEFRVTLSDGDARAALARISGVEGLTVVRDSDAGEGRRSVTLRLDGDADALEAALTRAGLDVARAPAQGDGT